MTRGSAFLLAAILCGCELHEQVPPFEVAAQFTRPAPFELPYTGIMIPTPDFANAKFETISEVALRASEEDESRVVAVVPEGTPVVLAGTTGGECNCVRVATPQGVGWVYARSIDLRPFAELE
jgi:hypothetical protein